MDDVQLIIFDLDNTLINYGGVTKSAWDLTCTKAARIYNVKAMLLSNEIYWINNEIWEDENKRPKGNFSFDELRRRIVSRALTNLGIDNQALITFLVDNYAKCKYEAVYLFDDVQATLQELKRRGYKLALLTNGDSEVQREKLQRFELEDKFDGIFIDGEMGVGKPEKAAYQKAADYFEIPMNQTCMVGDHYLWEVLAPKKYGMQAILVKRAGSPDFTDQEVEPDYTIEAIGALLDIFTRVYF